MVKEQYNLIDVLKQNPFEYVSRFSDGFNIIDLKFKISTVQDHFCDSILNEDDCLEAIERILSSDPIWKDILERVLKDENIKKSLNLQRHGSYYVEPHDFDFRDYRKEQ